MSFAPSSIRKRARALLRKEEEREGTVAKPTARSRADLVKKSGTSDREEGFKLKFGRFEEVEARRAFVVVPGEVDDGGVEIIRLAESLGLTVDGKKFLKRGRRITASSFLGSGTLEQLRAEIGPGEPAVLVIDARLSPGQTRNLESALGNPVLDRCTLILAIFKRNARSRIAKLQVELAELQILKSRLAGVWEGLSRQRGAAGGKGGRGLGETRLELDRRTLRRRTELIKAKLVQAEKSFYTQAESRSHFARVALVGYTNAGKSSLMQALTQTATHVEDKLFATLDTTVRALQPLTEPRVLVSDTVGFVRDLPAELVASFRSTLLEALTSSLLLHVVDVHSDDWKEQIEVTESTLAEIGAGEIKRIFVFNKTDQLQSFPRIKRAEISRHLLAVLGEGVAFVMTSVVTGEGLADLRLKVLEQCGVTERQGRSV